jgi:hypothetical protein
VLTYTGDSGPSQDVVVLAEDADLLIAEATYPCQVPPGDARSSPAPGRPGTRPRKPALHVSC